MQNKGIIFFDFDGVIVDSFDAAYKISSRYFETKSPNDYKQLFSGKIAEFMKKHMGDDQINDFFHHYGKELELMPIVPGISSVIEQLGVKYRLAVISSSHTITINKFLEHHKLRGFFSDILGYDVNPNKTEKITGLLEETQIDPDGTVMITDTSGDVEEARHAGVKSIAVTWGYQDENTLKASNPAKIISTPDDLPRAVNEFIRFD